MERKRKEDPIEERLLEDGQRSQEDIVTAANEAFVKDQEDPEHPSRRERRLGAEDPSHSRGSRRHGAGEQDFDQG